MQFGKSPGDFRGIHTSERCELAAQHCIDKLTSCVSIRTRRHGHGEMENLLLYDGRRLLD